MNWKHVNSVIGRDNELVYKVYTTTKGSLKLECYRKDGKKCFHKKFQGKYAVQSLKSYLLRCGVAYTNGKLVKRELRYIESLLKGKEELGQLLHHFETARMQVGEQNVGITSNVARVCALVESTKILIRSNEVAIKRARGK